MPSATPAIASRLAANGAEGLTLISSNVFDVMICDIRLPKVDGLTLFRRVRQESPGTDVILITAHAAVADAVAALKEGAYDYLTKPFDVDEIILQMERIAAQRALKRELEQARAELSQRKSNGRTGRRIIGRSPPMLRLPDRIETIAQSDAPVLITGESGTGKELVARTLHERSSRRAQALHRGQLRRLPGDAARGRAVRPRARRVHRRGQAPRRPLQGGRRRHAAARRDRRGAAAGAGQAAARAAGGTVEPLGTNESTRVDVRIISATHRNLRERIKEGRFREDLYYRLNVLDIEIPPLRERRGDLPLLLQYFLNKFTPAGQAAADDLAARLGGAVAVPVPRQRARVRARHRARGGAGGRRRDRRRAPARPASPARSTAAAARRAASLRSLERGAQGVRARVPAARAGPVQRQEDEGRRDPGDLAQEPLGEAAPARDRRRGRSRRRERAAAASRRTQPSGQKHRANTARTRAIRSSSSAASSVGRRAQAAGQRRQIARRDDGLRAVEQQPQPQRRPPEHGVVVAQRRGPAERDQPFEHRGRRRGADSGIGARGAAGRARPATRRP